MFTVSVILVLDSKYVQFQIICSLLCSATINTFKVDPHSIQYEQDAYHKRKHESRITTSTALIAREINMRELKQHSQHFS